MTVLMYLTNKHVSAYEVREGSILKDTAYTGLIIRDETVVNAEADGYVNYFAPEGNKVGAKTRVYTLSDKKLEFADATSESQELTSEEQSSILMKTQSFCESFKEQQFSDVYTPVSYTHLDVYKRQAIRIANGYSSTYAAEVGNDVMEYYYQITRCV